jgi:hypothetical protein
MYIATSYINMQTASLCYVIVMLYMYVCAL